MARNLKYNYITFSDRPGQKISMFKIFKRLFIAELLSKLDAGADEVSAAPASSSTVSSVTESLQAKPGSRASPTHGLYSPTPCSPPFSVGAGVALAA